MGRGGEQDGGVGISAEGVGYPVGHVDRSGDRIGIPGEGRGVGHVQRSPTTVTIDPS